MSYTLKVVSRMLDNMGQPRTQVWWPGVQMVSRIETRPLHEVLAGCWANYGLIGADYVSPTPPMSYQAADVRTGMVIDRWATDAAHANGEPGTPWRVRSFLRSPAGIVTIGYESMTGEVGESVDYDPDVYLETHNPSTDIVAFDPPVSLLWVQLPHEAMNMIVEQAFLMGPDGGTIDAIR